MFGRNRNTGSETFPQNNAGEQLAGEMGPAEIVERYSRFGETLVPTKTHRSGTIRFFGNTAVQHNVNFVTQYEGLTYVFAVGSETEFVTQKSVPGFRRYVIYPSVGDMEAHVEVGDFIPRSADPGAGFDVVEGSPVKEFTFDGELHPETDSTTLETLHEIIKTQMTPEDFAEMSMAGEALAAIQPYLPKASPLHLAA